MYHSRHLNLLVCACASLLLAAPCAFAQADAKLLRMVPHSNLVILDPIWTTAYISRNHGYMIYDTLFGTDEKSQIKPQMVDTWTVSPDKRLWTFTLRKGLEFHDGKPVTGEDVTASLARWGKRDSMGAALMTFVERMDAPAADGFRIFLREPCGFVLEALGKPSSNVPFIMPRRVAETDPFKQIEDTNGSGPYIFKRDEFKPGDKAVYLRNPKYVARNEPPAGSTGGKNVYFDRVEWNLALRDPQTQVNALARGEVDLVEQISFDHYEAVKANKDLRLFFYTPLGRQFMARFNHLHKPFDTPAVRRAAIAAFSQAPDLFGSYTYVTPTTRTVADTALMMQAMAGQYAGDPWSYAPMDDYASVAAHKQLSGTRIALLPRLGNSAVSRDVLDALDRSAKLLAGAGAEVEPLAEAAGEPFEPVEPLWRVINHSTWRARFTELVDKHRGIMTPTLVRQVDEAQAFSATDYQLAAFKRGALFRRIQGWFERYDALLMPTLTRTALPIENNLFDPVDIDGQMLPEVRSAWFPYTMPFNLTGHPAITLPAGLARDGLPLAIQLVGRFRRDADLLALAATYESLNDWNGRLAAGLP